MEEINGFYNTLLPLLEGKFEFLFVMGSDDNTPLIMTHMGYDYDKKTFTIPQRFVTNYKRDLNKENNRFNNDINHIIEQFEADKKVALVGQSKLPSENTITLGGEEYTIIGALNEPEDRSIEVPYNHLPRKLKVAYTSLYLTKPILEPEYEIIVSTAKIYFKDKVDIPEFYGIKNENEYRVYRSIIFILVVFMIMCGVNYCIVYGHLLNERRKMFAVSRICGCSKLKTICIYLIELLSISLVTLALGLVIFINAIMPNVKSIFEYMQYYFNTKIYIEIALIYLGVLLITYFILVLNFVKKTPVALMKEV